MSIEDELRAKLKAQQLVIDEQRQTINELQAIVERQQTIEELRDAMENLREEHRVGMEQLREEHREKHKTMELGMEKLRGEYKAQRDKDRELVTRNLKAPYKLHEHDMAHAYSRVSNAPAKKISMSSNFQSPRHYSGLNRTLRIRMTH